MVYETFFLELVILRKKKSDTVKGLIRVNLLVPNSLKTNVFFLSLCVFRVFM